MSQQTNSVVGFGINISTALLAAQTAMQNAVKAGNNPYFKSKYADLNSVREACQPLLNANGIIILQPTVQKEGKSYVRTLLVHAASGEWISSDTEIIASKPNDPQAAGSGLTYARRYGLQALVSLGADDDDGEKAMARSAPVAKAVAASGGTASLDALASIVANEAKPTSSFKKPRSNGSAAKTEASAPAAVEVDDWQN